MQKLPVSLYKLPVTFYIFASAWIYVYVLQSAISLELVAFDIDDTYAECWLICLTENSSIIVMLQAREHPNTLTD